MLLAVTACKQTTVKKELSPLELIKKRGVITVALEENSINYFLYKAHPVGYQLELLSRFANSMNLLMDVVPVKNQKEGLAALQNGDASIFAPSAPIKLEEKLYSTTKPCNCHIEPTDSLAWVMLAQYPDLLVQANLWLEKQTKSREMRVLQAKYGHNGYLRTALKQEKKITISPYDRLLKKEAKNLAWDWRLVAAVIFQESRFKPHVESPQGAYGIMQFTSSTASYFGIPHRAQPEVQIPAGVKYLHWLDEQFAKEGVPADTRTEFVLAAYNAGFGKVQRARQQAEIQGKTPNIWAGNVALVLSKDNSPTILAQRSSPLAAYGKGETCNFVREIMTRYQHYRNIVD